jgi:pyrroline-5-carboxylate reductase
MKVAVIGAGNLGMALAKNAAKKVDVIAIKRHVEKKTLERITFKSRIEDADGCDVYLVTLKPDVFRENLEKIGDVAGGRPVVSFAAGVKLKEMKKHIERPFRAITNLAIEDRSLVACYPAETVKHLEFLDAEFLECDSEEELEVMISYIGSSPAILACLIHAFILSAIKDGVPYERAIKVAVSSFRNSSDLYLKYGLDEMLKRIATPGGTTIEGILKVTPAKILLIDALLASSSKARRL